MLAQAYSNIAPFPWYVQIPVILAVVGFAGLALYTAGLVLIEWARRIADGLVSGAHETAERLIEAGSEALSFVLRVTIGFIGTLLELLWTALRLALDYGAERFAPIFAPVRRLIEARRLYDRDFRKRYESFLTFLRAVLNGDAEREERKERAAPPPPPPPRMTVESALRLFGIADGPDLTAAAFEERFRRLMRAVHPDIVGANDLARQLNEARDFIRKQKRWSR